MNLFKFARNVYDSVLKRHKTLLSKGEIESKTPIYNSLTNGALSYHKQCVSFKNIIEKNNKIQIDTIIVSNTEYIECQKEKENFNIESESFIDYKIIKKDDKNILIIFMAHELLMKD